MSLREVLFLDLVCSQDEALWKSGLFNEPDYIECVRACTKIPTISTGGVLFVQTSGFAEDISLSERFSPEDI